MIEIDNVSKWYGSFQVLTDCTTSVKKSEVVVVCGPSGSGKSTLIKTVNALEPFQKGEIQVNGISVGDPRTNLPKLRAVAGMVFQHFELVPHLSVTEMPSTVISPFCTGSSAFTVLISVDLPEPDGPHTTTTSPRPTVVEQSSSTWKSPYHLLTCLIAIIGGLEESCIVETCG